MTEVLTRTPLESLSMSAMQNGRRRSQSRAFDEEDARPAKRAKTEDAPKKPAKQNPGRKPAAATKKNKASYEEDADGFTFSRAKPKRSTTKAPAAAPIAETSTTHEDAPTSSQSRQKRGRPRRSSVEAPNEPARKKPTPTRRSARLSGDQVQTQHEEFPPQPSSQSQQKDVRTAKTPRSSEVHVEKKRGPTKIALPFADTPVIIRNKEMRKESAEGRRRSSSGMRGRRASSLIDSGTSNALPHSEVEPPDFYKHIHQDLSEPRRMKQLLVWCGTRALPQRPTDGAKDVNAVLAARTIQEELLRDFSNKNEMSDWFNREDIAPTALVKKPNPRNVQNAAKLQELELEVKRLKAEKANWDTALGSVSSANKNATPFEQDPSKVPTPEQVESKALDHEDQSGILSDLKSHVSTMDTSRKRLQDTTKTLELSIDTFADGVHKIEKLKESGDSVVDRILGQASSLLQQKDEAASTSAGTEKVGIGDLLRSLSRTT